MRETAATASRVIAWPTTTGYTSAADGEDTYERLCHNTDTTTSGMQRSGTLRVSSYVVPEQLGGGYGFSVVGPLTHAGIAIVGNGIFVATVDSLAAAASGLQPGLQLLSIERRPTAAITIDALSSLFSTAGSTVSVTAVLNVKAFRERQALPRYLPSRNGFERVEDDDVVFSPSPDPWAESAHHSPFHYVVDEGYPPLPPLPSGSDAGEVIYAALPTRALASFGDEDDDNDDDVVVHTVGVMNVNAGMTEPIYSKPGQRLSFPPPLPSRPFGGRPPSWPMAAAAAAALHNTALDVVEGATNSSCADDATTATADSKRSSGAGVPATSVGSDAANHAQSPIAP